ncbi:hypothetical protein LSH36_725g01088 [Paralvinella palmiformis]|uniref:Endonuclease/exonuclease/phosphatase domain-containing protein n=1 Tax=Paralvinella palmiformis TaxID=53620 RepID=A0AAD9J209_9ANNE|nr:hypothetical protein LSH36_725g01088 [Paralvinella palmiformis]
MTETWFRSGNHDQKAKGDITPLGYKLRLLYDPPKAPKGTDFFIDFANIIDQYSLMSGQLLIAGDYNNNRYCNEIAITKRFIDLLDSTNLVQHVSEPTHRDGHIIDLAVTRQDDNIVHMTSVQPMISDNMVIHIHLNMSKPPRPTRTISFRKIRAIDQNCLADDI